MDSLYTILLTLHSINRWLVLIAGGVAVVLAFTGWFGKRAWSGTDDRIGKWFTIFVDIQFVIGLFLYISFGWFANVMRSGTSADVRFFAVEHIIMMFIVLVLVHMGRLSVGGAEEDRKKHKRAAIWFGLALLLILIAIPWPWLEYGRPLLRLGNVGF